MVSPYVKELRINFEECFQDECPNVPTPGGALLYAVNTDGSLYLDGWQHFCDPKNYEDISYTREEVLGKGLFNSIKNKLYMFYNDNFIPNRFGEHFWREFND
jgi:hypothetical protein